MQDLDCFYFHLSVLIRFSKIQFASTSLQMENLTHAESWWLRWSLRALGGSDSLWLSKEVGIICLQPQNLYHPGRQDWVRECHSVFGLRPDRCHWEQLMQSEALNLARKKRGQTPCSPLPTHSRKAVSVRSVTGNVWTVNSDRGSLCAGCCVVNCFHRFFSFKFLEKEIWDK